MSGEPVTVMVAAPDVTVRPVFPDFPPNAADMVVEPAAIADVNPLVPGALEIVATEPSDEPQVTNVVISWLEPFE